MAKNKVPEVNASSMADISFLLLIFFLVATTMDTDKGLARMLPPIVPETQDAPPVNERDVFEVLVNARNELLVEKQPMHMSQLKDATKEFLANPLGLATLPAKREVEVPYFGIIPIAPNAVISLQSDRGTTYQTYLSVQNELQAAIDELRNEISKRQFNKNYSELDEEQQKAVRVIYPQKISEAEPRSIKK
ncbi:MAG: biopolymer transporter ExbD [Cytophagaceae bacterium]|jgi:biopolymer transport protein ExbD|nr:biopolymer transporter ExbD [Cytophagaceae bacterium]